MAAIRPLLLRKLNFTKTLSSMPVRAYSSEGSSPGLSKRRVVVTGLGLVTPLGTGVQHNWRRLVVGDVGIRSLVDYKEFEHIPSKVAGLVQFGSGEGNFNPHEWYLPTDRKNLPKSLIFALSASIQAMGDAKWAPKTIEEKRRTGVAIGTGMSNLDEILKAYDTLNKQGYGRVSPFMVPYSLPNMASGVVSIRFGLQGPCHAVSTACATGAHAIGDASRFIKHGDADVMVCGGTDACVLPVVMAGFCRAQALSLRNDDPLLSSRPFDKNRDGFVIAEGAGVLVLEELEHALKRGANIYAEIKGYGLSGEGHHLTAPTEDGDGAYRCMEAALRDAGLSPDQINYINAHATSTPLGDAIELRAISRLFASKKSPSVLVSSTKGATGHLLGAAGAVEAIFSILSLHHCLIPPTVNLESSDIAAQHEGTLQLVQNSTASRLNNVLTNSFGFGGTNASLCFSRFSKE